MIASKKVPCDQSFLITTSQACFFCLDIFASHTRRVRGYTKRDGESWLGLPGGRGRQRGRQVVKVRACLWLPVWCRLGGGL
jgi:hypothetical protein